MTPQEKRILIMAMMGILLCIATIIIMLMGMKEGATPW